MKVNEIFYSIQGEGPNIGAPSVFLRLSGCNLRCKWCDTKYAWEAGEELNIDNIAKYIKQCPCNRLVVTGGEPLIQQQELIKLIERMYLHEIEIETNGTIFPDWDLYDRVSTWIVSPKLSNSGVKPYAIGAWIYEFEDVYLKFPVNSEQDVMEVVEGWGEVFPNNHIYIMPLAADRVTYNKLLPSIIEWGKRYDLRVSPRLHIMVWDNKRGV